MRTFLVLLSALALGCATTGTLNSVGADAPYGSGAAPVLQDPACHGGAAICQQARMNARPMSPAGPFLPR